jgi:ATP-dependent Clp protease ATP-binding subunit ClpX
MGIGAAIAERRKKNTGELLAAAQTEDLMKFGMIPEFLGRLPVVATLEDLDENALVEILTKPKNAITKQYQRLMDLEGVKLVFEDEALRAVAREAIKKKTGARGLRSILETSMLDVMYEIPSLTGCKTCTVTQDTIEKKEKPTLAFENPPSVITKKESA